MMPGEDGLSVARRLRAEQPLSSHAVGQGDIADHRAEVGADYLPKPWPRAIGWRASRGVAAAGGAAAPAPRNRRLVHFGPFSVILDARTPSRDGAEITLTSGEYALLEIFVTHANRALSRDWLMDQLRGLERDPFDRSIDVRVNRLRKKIENDPANPAYIRTQRGQGYLFVPQGKG
jgi:two-component system OmpR family response regulator/two-component system phosphate regulon response regulator OmpR